MNPPATPTANPCNGAADLPLRLAQRAFAALIEEPARNAARNGAEFRLAQLRSAARRLQQHVRPLDVLVRLEDGHFGLLTLLSDLQECSPTSFKRLHEGLNLKAFKTSEGFISIKAGISLVGLDAQSLPTTPQTLLDRASDLLPDACSSGRINAVRLPKAQ